MATSQKTILLHVHCKYSGLVSNLLSLFPCCSKTILRMKKEHFTQEWRVIIKVRREHLHHHGATCCTPCPYLSPVYQPLWIPTVAHLVGNHHNSSLWPLGQDIPSWVLSSWHSNLNITDDAKASLYQATAPVIAVCLKAKVECYQHNDLLLLMNIFLVVCSNSIVSVLKWPIMLMKCLSAPFSKSFSHYFGIYYLWIC